MSYVKFFKKIFVNEEKKKLKEKQKECDHEFEQVGRKMSSSLLHEGDISRTYYCDKCHKIKKVKF